MRPSKVDKYIKAIRHAKIRLTVFEQYRKLDRYSLFIYC